MGDLQPTFHPGAFKRAEADRFFVKPLLPALWGKSRGFSTSSRPAGSRIARDIQRNFVLGAGARGREPEIPSTLRSFPERALAKLSPSRLRFLHMTGKEKDEIFFANGDSLNREVNE